MKIRSFIVGMLLLCIGTPFGWARTYQLDRHHSSVNFKIRHLVSWVQGSFGDFEARFVYKFQKPELWKVHAVIQSASINTGVAERDKHLRSTDFFDVATYPEIRFESTEVTDVTESSAKVHGLLTMHGVQRPVVLDLEIYGTVQDPWGHQRAGFTAKTLLNRKDFGLSWTKALETGGVLIGDEVQVTIEAEGILQPDEASSTPE